MPTGKPATDKRDAWVSKQVKAGRNVLICNPRLVSTGLDLVDFHTIVVYETPYSLYTLSQASRRTWRIGQTKDCRVYYLYYRGTMEEQAISLVSKKQAAAALLGGDAEGGGLAQLSTGGGLSLEAELARLIAEDEQVVDASQLFRENARRSIDFTSGWATGQAASHPEPKKGEIAMRAAVPERANGVPQEYRAARAKYPDVLILVDRGETLQTYGADAERLSRHADAICNDHTALIPSEKAQTIIAALNEAGIRVAVIKARQSETQPKAGAPATNGRKPHKKQTEKKRTGSAASGRKAAPEAIPGITPAHPNADLLNKSFYDDDHRLTTVTGPDNLFPDTHVKVLRTLPDGSRRAYSLPADRARRCYASDPVDAPQPAPMEAPAAIPGLTSPTQAEDAPANAPQEAAARQPNKERRTTPTGDPASTGQTVRANELAAAEPSQAGRTLRVRDAFTYEGRLYQLHSVTPESELYPEGEFRADDLSGGIPVRRVFTSLVRFEETTGYQVERPTGDKPADPAPSEGARYKVFCAPSATGSEQEYANRGKPVCLLTTNDKAEACAFARTCKAQQPDDLITVADELEGRVILTPTLSDGSWMKPEPQPEKVEPSTGEGVADESASSTDAVHDLSARPSEIQWLIDHAVPQVDFENHYALIPNSGVFKGRLPRHMVGALRRFLDGRSASVRDGGRQVYHSWKEGSLNYTLAFGTTTSTANQVRFTFTPDTWEVPDQPERRDVPYTLSYKDNWTWLAFATKPVHSATLDGLKAMGFRWSRKRKAQVAERRIPQEVIEETLGYAAESVICPIQDDEQKEAPANLQPTPPSTGDGAAEPATVPTVAGLAGRIIGELIDTDGSSTLLRIQAAEGRANRYKVAATDETPIPAFSAFDGDAGLPVVLAILKREAREHHRCLEPIDLDGEPARSPEDASANEKLDTHCLPATDEDSFAAYLRAKRDHPAPLVFVETPGGLVTYLEDARTTADALTLPLTRLPVGGRPLTPKANIRQETGEVYLSRLRERYPVALSNGDMRVLAPLDGPPAGASPEEAARDLA